MKKLVIFLALFVGLAITANAQLYFNYNKLDSIVNSTAVTYTITAPDMAKYNYYISVTLQADSASGSTSGVMALQVSNMASGDYWVTLSSTTINGVQTTATVEDIIYYRRARLYFTGGGTQKTYVRFGIHMVKLP